MLKGPNALLRGGHKRDINPTPSHPLTNPLRKCHRHHDIEILTRLCPIKSLRAMDQGVAHSRSHLGLLFPHLPQDCIGPGGPRESMPSRFTHHPNAANHWIEILVDLKFWGLVTFRLRLGVWVVFVSGGVSGVVWIIGGPRCASHRSPRGAGEYPHTHTCMEREYHPL